MEIITKKISLEDYKTRYASHIPSYQDNAYYDTTHENRGKMPMDAVIGSGMTIYPIVGQLPHINENEKQILRYWDVKDMYSLIKKIASTAKWYKLCRRNDELKWVSHDGDFYDEVKYSTITVIDQLPNAQDTSYTAGDIVCVASDVALTTRFNSCFRKAGSTTRYELKFIDFFKKLHQGLHTGYTKPFIDVQFTIGSDSEDIGQYSMDGETWIPKKKYYLGDFVIYGDLLYMLVKGYDGRITGDTYYRGYYNTGTTITEFDEPNNPHWKKVDVTETTESAVSAYKESKLVAILPYKRTFDDNGNILPFTINNSKQTYFLYNFEPKNLSVGNGGSVYGDLLTKIRVMDGNRNTINSFDYSSITTPYIASSDFTNDSKYVNLQYILHGELLPVSSSTSAYTIDYESGIRYSETYPIEYKSVKIDYDGQTGETYNYWEISEMLHVNADGTMRQWSEIEFNPITLTSSAQCTVFKNDVIHGVHGIDEKSDNLYVTRGTSSARERHSILMEISSFDDLQNYRNNYFNI